MKSVKRIELFNCNKNELKNIIYCSAMNNFTQVQLIKFYEKTILRIV